MIIGRPSTRGGLAVCGALAVALFTRPAPAYPNYGVADCTLCHGTPRVGMSLTHFQTQTNLGEGLVKVFQAPAGGMAVIQYYVDNDRGGYYGLAFDSPIAGGFNNRSNQLSYIPDPAWDSEADGNYFTVGPTTNNPTVWSFNLQIAASTQPDLYPIKTVMAGVDNNFTPWSQVESFYVQVLPNQATAPALLRPKWQSGVFSVDLVTSSGSTYYLEYKTAPADAAWTTASKVPGNGAVETLVDASANGPQRFYRLRVE
jgi:hypothetical protein